MASPRRRTTDVPQPPAKRRRATTPEGREKELISKAIDLVERQIDDGTVSAQVLSHYVKLASIERQEQLEKLRHENKLLAARTEQITASAGTQADAAKALRAFRGYSGEDVDDDLEI